MTDIKADGDMEKDENVAGLIRFLLKWSRRLEKIPFGEDALEQSNWNCVAFGNPSPMGASEAETLALRMLNSSEKLRPYEVFLFAFWKVMQTPERLYLNLLDEHRRRFFCDIFEIQGNRSVHNETIEDGSKENELDFYSKDDEIFVLRTRHRFLNVDDLRKGFNRRFPQYRALIEARADNAGTGSGAMQMAVLRRERDDNNQYALTASEQRVVQHFLNETTSVYANIRPEFEHVHDKVNVWIDWLDGVDQSKKVSEVNSAFREWTWTLWQFQKWDVSALENEVRAFILSQKIAKTFTVEFDPELSCHGLLTLNLQTNSK